MDQYQNIFSSNVSAPVRSPLNNSQTAKQMPQHNLGVLSGKHPNPPKFYPSANDSIARSQYMRTSSYLNATKTGYNNLPVNHTSFYNAGTHKTYASLGNTKYKAPSDSSMYLSTLKSRAVGKSSYTTGIPSSHKNYNTNDVNHALKSVRGGGCVAPPKKRKLY